METLIYIIIVIGVFITMEGVTWLVHKYVMHGFLWYLHRDHHQPHKGLTEKNDLFFVIFAIPSFLLFYYGTYPNLNYRFFIGLGILFYGIAYFLVHDIIIHQRIKRFRNIKSTYFLGLRRGHKIHHKHLNKEDGECFGMLCVPQKYFFRNLKK